MNLEIVLIVFAAIVIGGVIGWLLGSRHDRGAATVDALRITLDGVNADLTGVRVENERLKAGGEERERAFELRLAEMKEARDALAQQFEAVGTKLLESAQAKFLERADARFKQSEETAGQGLKALLQPMESTLKRYEESLSRVEKEREGSYRELYKAVSDLTTTNDVVRQETSRLANVMRSSPKHRGRWGEEQTQTILESAGLREGIDFTMQRTVSDGERQLRPDFVINLPGDRCIVIDVKCPLVHFEAAFEEENDDRRHGLLKQHADAVRAYAKNLGSKSYWKQYDLSPEFTILFVPGEHFLSAAAERSPDLITDAFKDGVIIASTINLLALAKVMAGMWRQEALQRQAEEVGALGRDLYARLCTMGGHVSRLGKNLDTAIGAYNAFVGSFERNVLTSAQRFERLGVDTGGKRLESLPIVEQTANPLVKLSSSMEPESPVITSRNNV